MIDVNIIKQYLGTNLKCRASNWGDKEFEFAGIDRNDAILMSGGMVIGRSLDNVFPILHPLSEFNSYTIRELTIKLECTISQVREIWDLEEGKKTIDQITFGMIDIMNRNHIDYNDLIGKGLAIDEKTIK